MLYTYFYRHKMDKLHQVQDYSWSSFGELKTEEDLKNGYKLRYNLHFVYENRVKHKNERINNANSGIALIEKRLNLKLHKKDKDFNMYIPSEDQLTEFEGDFSDNNINALIAVFGGKIEFKSYLVGERQHNSSFSLSSSSSAKKSNYTFKLIGPTMAPKPEVPQILIPKTKEQSTDPNIKRKYKISVEKKDSKTLTRLKQGWGKILKEITHKSEKNVFGLTPLKTENDVKGFFEKYKTESSSKTEKPVPPPTEKFAFGPGQELNFMQQLYIKIEEAKPLSSSDKIESLFSSSPLSHVILEQINNFDVFKGTGFMKDVNSFKDAALILFNKTNIMYESQEDLTVMLFENIKEMNTSQRNLMLLNENLKIQDFLSREITDISDLSNEKGRFISKVMINVTTDFASIINSIIRNYMKSADQPKEEVKTFSQYDAAGVCARILFENFREEVTDEEVLNDIYEKINKKHKLEVKNVNSSLDYKTVLEAAANQFKGEIFLVLDTYLDANPREKVGNDFMKEITNKFLDLTLTRYIDEYYSSSSSKIDANFIGKKPGQFDFKSFFLALLKPIIVICLYFYLINSSNPEYVPVAASGQKTGNNKQIVYHGVKSASSAINSIYDISRYSSAITPTSTPYFMSTPIVNMDDVPTVTKTRKKVLEKWGTYKEASTKSLSTHKFTGGKQTENNKNYKLFLNDRIKELETEETKLDSISKETEIKINNIAESTDKEIQLKKEKLQKYKDKTDQVTTKTNKLKTSYAKDLEGIKSPSTDPELETKYDSYETDEASRNNDISELETMEYTGFEFHQVEVNKENWCLNKNGEWNLGQCLFVAERKMEELEVKTKAFTEDLSNKYNAMGPITTNFDIYTKENAEDIDRWQRTKEVNDNAQGKEYSDIVNAANKIPLRENEVIYTFKNEEGQTHVIILPKDGIELETATNLYKNRIYFHTMFKNIISPTHGIQSMFKRTYPQSSGANKNFLARLVLKTAAVVDQKLGSRNTMDNDIIAKTDTLVKKVLFDEIMEVVYDEKFNELGYDLPESFKTDMQAVAGSPSGEIQTFKEQSWFGPLKDAITNQITANSWIDNNFDDAIKRIGKAEFETDFAADIATSGESFSSFWIFFNDAVKLIEKDLVPASITRDTIQSILQGVLRYFDPSNWSEEDRSNLNSLYDVTTIGDLYKVSVYDHCTNAALNTKPIDYAHQTRGHLQQMSDDWLQTKQEDAPSYYSKTVGNLKVRNVTTSASKTTSVSTKRLDMEGNEITLKLDDPASKREQFIPPVEERKIEDIPSPENESWISSKFSYYTTFLANIGSAWQIGTLLFRQGEILFEVFNIFKSLDISKCLGFWIGSLGITYLSKGLVSVLRARSLIGSLKSGVNIDTKNTNWLTKATFGTLQFVFNIDAIGLKPATFFASEFSAFQWNFRSIASMLHGAITIGVLSRLGHILVAAQLSLITDRISSYSMADSSSLGLIQAVNSLVLTVQIGVGSVVIIQVAKIFYDTDITKALVKEVVFVFVDYFVETESYKKTFYGRNIEPLFFAKFNAYCTKNYYTYPFLTMLEHTDAKDTLDLITRARSGMTVDVSDKEMYFKLSGYNMMKAGATLVGCRVIHTMMMSFLSYALASVCNNPYGVFQKNMGLNYFGSKVVSLNEKIKNMLYTQKTVEIPVTLTQTYVDSKAMCDNRFQNISIYSSSSDIKQIESIGVVMKYEQLSYHARMKMDEYVVVRGNQAFYNTIRTEFKSVFRTNIEMLRTYINTANIKNPLKLKDLVYFMETGIIKSPNFLPASGVIDDTVTTIAIKKK